jgi:hypothetical protein
MANVKIVATGLTYTGTSDADSIQFLSGALQGSTILGVGGNDTINLTESFVGATKNGYLADAGEGDDSIFVNSATFKASAGPTLKGGSGADTISLSGGTIQILNGQDGADRLVASAITTFGTVKGGKNADEIVLSGAVISGSLGLGRGHDKISASVFTMASSADVSLGEGRDTINATVASNGSANTIHGDAGNGVNAGADLMDLELGTITGITVNAGGGADTVGVSGGYDSANIKGGKGDDLITISGVLAENSSIGGGSGNDTITIASAESFNSTGIILGGEGADVITINSVSGVSGSLTTIQGGAGADSITLNYAVVSGIETDTNTFSFSSLSDSNLAATDSVTVSASVYSGVGVSATFDFNNSATVGAVTVASAAAIFGNAANKATMASNGVVTFSGTLATDAVSSVTAAMATVDTLTLADKAGATALFTANGAEYLFMQGGTAGTSDDALVKLGGLSANAIAVSSAATVTFSGTAS